MVKKGLMVPWNPKEATFFVVEETDIDFHVRNGTLGVGGRLGRD